MAEREVSHFGFTIRHSGDREVMDDLELGPALRAAVPAGEAFLRVRGYDRELLRMAPRGAVVHGGPVRREFPREDEASLRFGRFGDAAAAAGVLFDVDDEDL